MNLKTLKKDWESLAERDALHSILTDQRRAGGKWDLAEFMATGEAEMKTVMSHLAHIPCVPNYAGAALDFGCGVGRVTQALAQYFASCAGVDISQQMIHKAESLNRYAHCRYLANSEEKLPLADASFSFIYSNIVLQHVPRRFSTAYLREFVRLLEPGGILIFGVQDSFATPRRLFHADSRPPRSSHPIQNERRAGSRYEAYANALSSGARRPASTWVRQDRRYSIHKHGGERFQWRTGLFAAGAHLGLCWQTILRGETVANVIRVRIPFVRKQAL